jgi:hypothetical protein
MMLLRPTGPLFRIVAATGAGALLAVAACGSGDKAGAAAGVATTSTNGSSDAGGTGSGGTTSSGSGTGSSGNSGTGPTTNGGSGTAGTTGGGSGSATTSGSGSSSTTGGSGSTTGASGTNGVSGSNGSTGTNATSSGPDAGGEAGAGAPASCPSMPPTLDAPCLAEGTQCTYGSSPRPACRDLRGCGGIMYCNCGSDNCPPSACTILKSWGGGGAGNLPALSPGGNPDRCSWTCPASPPKVGEACTAPGYCAMPDGTQCGCIRPDSTGNGYLWACLPPPSDPRCPRVAPLLGTACSNEGLACGNYDICVDGARVLCRGGIWVDNFGNCPN